MTTPLNQLESLGRYTLTRELGRGGMSVVYLAKDSELGREVAIKCVDTSDPSAAKLAERLRSEAKLLAQLNHPNIVQLYDVVEQGNIVGLVIEFIGGDTLTQRLKQAPSKEVKLKWLAEIAEGLASAHQKGIAHCDLKADNVLITHDSIAKVADFGIAKVKLDDYLEDDGLTRVDSVSGSYFSLSPEQALGEAVDTRTDLFSLAILVYQTLIGQHPFGKTHNKVTLLQRLINDTLEINPTTQVELGARLSELVKNLLSKKPEERLYNAKEAAELLRSTQSHNSSIALEETTLEIPLKHTNTAIVSNRKNPKVLFRNGVLVTLGFTVGILAIWAYENFIGDRQETNYVALDKIEIETTPGFNPELLLLVRSALQESAEQALLSLSNTNLISQREFEGVKGSYLDKAKATGAGSIISIKANCEADKCDITLRKYDGSKMAVTMQKNWPVAVQYLTGIRDVLSGEIFNLYPELEKGNLMRTIAEDSYREYLELFLSSENGKKSTPEHLLKLEKLVNEQPYFQPAYSLAGRAVEILYSRNQKAEYLERLERILSLVPQKLANEPEILDARISLKLLQNKPNDAEKLFELAKQVISDEATLVNLETNLAFYGNKLDRLLELDKRNALLRPSAKNYYNLAHSEQSFGNYIAADRALNSALKLYPTYSFAHNLKGIIAMEVGDLDQAIEHYERAIKLNPTATTNSNLGKTHTLSGNYKKAIKHFDIAIKLSPNNPAYIAELANAHKLNDEFKLANSYYQKVISLTENPNTRSDFRRRTEALAHTGNYIDAIKALNSANKKYPNQADLQYSAAVVHTLSNNNVAALVAIEDTLNQGTGKIWFSYPWFKPLCGLDSFKVLTSPETQPLCKSLTRVAL